MSPQRRRALLAAAALAVLAFAAYVLARDIHSMGWVAITRAWRSLSIGSIAASGVFTLLSFACLALLEVIACGTVPRRPIPRGRALRTGIGAHALCNTLGFHAVLAPALRLASYRRDGATTVDVARLLAVVAGGIACGVTAAAVLAAMALAGGRLAASCMVALIAALLGAWRRFGAPGGNGPFARLLQAGPAAAAVGMFEAGFAMAALYVLMPAQSIASPAHFVLAFVSAGLLGIVSHSPGGVGVFEAAMLTALPGDRAQLFAALVAYRVIYNVAPAAFAATGLAARGLRARRTALSSTVDTGRSRAAGPDTASPAP